MVEWYKENNNDEQTIEYINELNYWQTVKTKLETIEKELQNK